MVGGQWGMHPTFHRAVRARTSRNPVPFPRVSSPVSSTHACRRISDLRFSILVVVPPRSIVSNAFNHPLF